MDYKVRDFKIGNWSCFLPRASSKFIHIEFLLLFYYPSTYYNKDLLTVICNCLTLYSLLTNLFTSLLILLASSFRKVVRAVWVPSELRVEDPSVLFLCGKKDLALYPLFFSSNQLFIQEFFPFTPWLHSFLRNLLLGTCQMPFRDPSRLY